MNIWEDLKLNLIWWPTICQLDIIFSVHLHLLDAKKLCHNLALLSFFGSALLVERFLAVSDWNTLHGKTQNHWHIGIILEHLKRWYFQHLDIIQVVTWSVSLGVFWTVQILAFIGRSKCRLLVDPLNTVLQFIANVLCLKKPIVDWNWNKKCFSYFWSSTIW